MFINKLAQQTGLTPHTIRFYEKEGFLAKRYIRRRENNYRDYVQEAVEHLLLIKSAQAAGFTLAEIKAFAQTAERGELTPQMKVAFLQQKMDTISGKIAALERIQTDLRTYLTRELALMHSEEHVSVPGSNGTPSPLLEGERRSSSDQGGSCLR
jgi:DNA-binding transcriptional MerR regulator